MVLFIEDEKRMKEMERQEKLAKRTRLGTLIRRLVKIGLALGVLFCAGLMLTSDLVWEQGLWAALGALFVLQLIIYARSIQSLK